MSTSIRLARLGAASAAAALTVSGFVLASGTMAAHANTASPAANGGVYTPFLVAGDFSDNPANAITGGGFWGHEGPNRSVLTTNFSADGTDGGTALNNAFQLGPSGDPTTQVGVAFVATSPNAASCSNATPCAERPTVSAGETAGQAFGWFTTINLGAGVTGDDPTSGADAVLMVSTQAQWDAWVNAGAPAEGFASDLTLHDSLVSGNPSSGSHSQGTSILNTWPAGTNISLVYFAVGTPTASGEPTVAVGPDNRAITAWVPFTTVANPSRAIATSGGYQFVGLAQKPVVSLSQSVTGDSDVLTATVKKSDGTTVATDATGTVQFAALPKNSTSGTYVSVGNPAPVTNGVATTTISFSGSGLSAGDIQKYQATYTPDAAATSKYLTSNASNPLTVQGPAVTSPTPTPSPTSSPTPTPAPSAYAVKLKQDQAALATAKKALKKASGAKKLKLKKKIAALQKAIKIDQQMVAAGHRTAAIG